MAFLTNEFGKRSVPAEASRRGASRLFPRGVEVDPLAPESYPAHERHHTRNLPLISGGFSATPRRGTTRDSALAAPAVAQALTHRDGSGTGPGCPG
ncbi:hypothetical protein Sliba_01710 [Streptomyces nigrescens]|uniref:Uncharacterized protein n=1 Tax=Streptomyces nigrescens TaxID=1920 RepID=A0A640T8S8_STRNI|nr:hypothetical protein Sliba_01710 [Streptomyces libani subsp. libani]GGW04204.1 hypothetical protein GCM10010500_65690 [Streptomyces libani subsp. libani]